MIFEHEKTNRCYQWNNNCLYYFWIDRSPLNKNEIIIFQKLLILDVFDLFGLYKWFRVSILIDD
jgi:hypothetical protein